MTTFGFKNINNALPELCKAVLAGDEVGSRQGERTKEILFPHIVLRNPLQREILLPQRKASLPAQIAETMWVLSGRDDVAWLANYLPRAEDFSDDGSVWRGAYGPRLRNWGGVDQLAHVVNLLTTDPSTRRAVMTIYDPARDSQDGKDIPCNNWLHFISRMGQLDLHVAIRSNDLIWGWSGINAFEWSVLLELVANMTGLKVGALHFSISSLHIYGKHWAKAQRIVDDPFQAGTSGVSPRFSPIASVGHWDSLASQWFALEKEIREHKRTEEIKYFPDTQMRGWLAVLAHYWTGDPRHLEYYAGTPLATAALLSPNRISAPKANAFQEYVNSLHAEKHAVYGDSWCRRGEMLGIMSNVARKVDRLGKPGGGDTDLDTAVDLLVYLAKYRVWIGEALKGEPVFWSVADGHVRRVATVLASLKPNANDKAASTEALNEALRACCDSLEHNAANNERRAPDINNMARLAYTLAERLWRQQANETRKWNPES